MINAPDGPTEWPHDAGRDRLIGDWHIYQRTGGHRTSTDDLITAWYAVHRNPNPPARYLDLGCGVGSVLLMVSHKLRPKTALGVEAQAHASSILETSATTSSPGHRPIFRWAPGCCPMTHKDALAGLRNVAA
ncbi:MAG: hypothetical protein JRG70_17685 [Deltaproteobacteria bacterium]|nr:hypothetical protein [Deltaproteobacteria bacterium]